MGKLILLWKNIDIFVYDIARFGLLTSILLNNGKFTFKYWSSLNNPGTNTESALSFSNQRRWERHIWRRESVGVRGKLERFAAILEPIVCLIFVEVFFLSSLWFAFMLDNQLEVEKNYTELSPLREALSPIDSNAMTPKASVLSGNAKNLQMSGTCQKFNAWSTNLKVGRNQFFLLLCWQELETWSLFATFFSFHRLPS